MAFLIFIILVGVIVAFVLISIFLEGNIGFDDGYIYYDDNSNNIFFYDNDDFDFD